MKRPATPSKGSDNNAKRRRSVVIEPCHINPKYLEKDMKIEFKKELDKNEPFPNWQFRNFLNNSENLVESIENELQEFEDWKRKENDLYSLYQTDDFKTICPLKHPSLYTFRQFLYTEVREWLQETSGIELIRQVDCNGSCYSHTDALLPHNDLIDTRRFAFVYYLTSQKWDGKTNGGNLQLLNCNKKGFPTSVVKELLPLRNSLVIFEVSEKSWHRVAEILSNDEPRLSINGWFHSSRIIEAKRPKAEKIHRFLPDTKSKISLYVNPEYLKDERQNEVQQVFAENSELNLTDFLLESLHNSVFEELTNNAVFFKYFGPMSKRRVARIGEDQIETMKKTKKLMNMLKSVDFASLVEKMSGVCLNGAKCSLKISRIEQSTYWVLGDEDAEQSINDGYCLDVHLFVQNKKWVAKTGGDLIYIADGEEEELLRISPSKNAASMVFREPGVLSFLKLANSRAGEPFFLFTLSFFDVQVVDD